MDIRRFYYSDLSLYLRRHSLTPEKDFWQILREESVPVMTMEVVKQHGVNLRLGGAESRSVDEGCNSYDP